MSLYELEDQDIKNLLGIINKSNITGDSAEAIVILKNKLRCPKKEETKDGGK